VRRAKDNAIMINSSRKKYSDFYVFQTFFVTLWNKVYCIMDASVLLSKGYVNEVISDYVEVVDNIDEIIKQTGYKGKFIAKKMGLSESAFYQKKRNKSFTHTEMQQIVAMMDDDGEDDDAIESAYFMKILRDRENETPITLEELVARRNAKKQKQ
jgi:hypothetical protein